MSDIDKENIRVLINYIKQNINNKFYYLDNIDNLTNIKSNFSI